MWCSWLGCFAGIIALAAGIGGVPASGAARQQSPNQKDPAAPGFSPASSPYRELVARYRDAASRPAETYEDIAAALLALPDASSAGYVFRQFQELAVAVAGTADPLALQERPLIRLADAWGDQLPAAAAMHLEAGFHACHQADVDRCAAHLSVARTLVEWGPWVTLMKLRPELGARHASLKRDINVGIVWTLQAFRQLDALGGHLGRIRSQYPGDAMIRLAQGSLEELRATAVEVMATQPPGRMAMTGAASWRRSSQLMRWEKAEEHYRAALKLDPSLVEARVRLGRVLMLRGKAKDARRELEEARALFPDAASVPAFGAEMVVPYLGLMFLGDAIEGDGDAAAALTVYQEVARRFPDCQSGALALSRAYEASGDRPAALAALRTLGRVQAARQCVDPWWTYNLGQGYRFGLLIRQLRTQLRGPS
jgi:tetratricopeptide (TPR) repeat protein